jgi:hypothetical protein
MLDKHIHTNPEAMLKIASGMRDPTLFCVLSKLESIAIHKTLPKAELKFHGSHGPHRLQCGPVPLFYAVYDMANALDSSTGWWTKPPWSSLAMSS